MTAEVADALWQAAGDSGFLGLSGPSDAVRGVLDRFIAAAPDAWSVRSMAGPGNPLASAGANPFLLTLGGMDAEGVSAEDEFPDATEWMDTLRSLGGGRKLAIVLPPAATGAVAHQAHIPFRLQWLSALFSADLVLVCTDAEGWAKLGASWAGLAIQQPLPQPIEVPALAPREADPSLEAPVLRGVAGGAVEPQWCVATNSDPALSGDGTTVFLRTTGSVRGLRPSDGEELWACSIDRPDTSTDNDMNLFVPPIQRGPYLFVAGSRHVTVIDTRAGEPVRYLALPKLSAMAVCGDRLFSTKDGSDALLCVDWTTGQKLELTGLPRVISLWDVVDASDDVGDDVVITTPRGVFRLRVEGKALAVVWHNTEVTEAVSAHRDGDLLIATAHCPAVIDLATGATRWHKPRTRTDFGLSTDDALVLGTTKFKAGKLDTSVVCLERADGVKRWGAKIPVKRDGLVATASHLVCVARTGTNVSDAELQVRALSNGRKKSALPDIRYQLSSELTRLYPLSVALVADDRIVSSHLHALVGWSITS